MGYVIKAGLGLALFFGGLVVFNVQLQELLDIGTCASGNTPYVIAQPCPEGTGTKILLLMGSIVGGLIGCALFAFRGDPPWGQRKTFGMFGWGTLAWGIFFAGTGLALMLGGPYGEITDPETGEVVGRPDSQLGATITGITFLVMGVPALLLGLWSALRGLTGRDERPKRASSGSGMLSGMSGWGGSSSGGGGSAPTSWPSSGSTGARKATGGDTIARIERLQKLKESGALTDTEFEREKAKVLAEE
jgi:hypothetical protein